MRQGGGGGLGVGQEGLQLSGLMLDTWKVRWMRWRGRGSGLQADCSGVDNLGDEKGADEAWSHLGGSHLERDVMGGLDWRLENDRACFQVRQQCRIKA